MALIFADRIKETSTTTGMGSLTLAGATTGFKSFNSEMNNGDTCYYCIDDTIGNWEIGLGTYQDTDILARTTVIKSTNANSLVNFTAGTKLVFLTSPAIRERFHPVGVFSNTAIAATANTDNYLIVPEDGVISSVIFSGTTALSADDTNYITFSITNLGQDGTGAVAVLNPTAANTTQATGGFSIAANTRHGFTLNSTASNLNVVAGDRLLIRAAVTGTLANTVTYPAFMIYMLGA